MTLRKILRFGALYLCVSLLFCACLGAALYLARTAVHEPLFQLMVEGQQLKLSFFGQERQFSMVELARITAQLHTFLIFLPPPLRLLLKLLLWLLGQ